ncbi:MAG: alpha/beta hydrolase [Saprospiraceae bacterium]
MNKYLHFEGKKWSYEISGNENAIPVFLLHGFCESSELWRHFVSMLDSSYCIVCIDQPGFGQTDRVENWNFDLVANFLNHFLDHFDKKDCLLIGHSMGGYSAAAFQKLYSDRVKGICFFHSHPFADSEEKKAGRDKAARLVQNHGSEKFIRELIHSIYSKDFISSNPEELQTQVLESQKASPLAVTDGLMAMKNREDLSKYFIDVQQPIQYIIGAEDKTLEPASIWKGTYLAQANLISYLSQSAHAGMIEEPMESASAINQFLEYCR